MADGPVTYFPFHRVLRTFLLQFSLASLGVRQTPSREAKHQTRCSGHDHTDSHQRADHPQRAWGPLPPNQQTQDQSDNSVEQNPARSRDVAALKISHQVKHSLEHEENRQHQGECSDPEYGMQQKIKTDDQIQNRDQQLPQYVSHALRLEGMNELKCSAEHDEPGDDDDHAPRGNEREANRQETEDD